jgi:hypothetical protein
MRPIAALLTAFLLAFSHPAVAITFPRPQEGKVIEICGNQLCEFTVWGTDARGGIIQAFGFPSTKTARLGEEADFGIPLRVQTGPNPGDDQAVLDVFQRTRIIMAGIVA